MEAKSNKYVIQVIISPELISQESRHPEKKWIQINVSSNITQQIQQQCGIDKNQRFRVLCPQSFEIKTNVVMAQVIQHCKGPYHVIPDQGAEEQKATGDTPMSSTIRKRSSKTVFNSGTELKLEPCAMGDTSNGRSESSKEKEASRSLCVEQNSKHEDSGISEGSMLDSSESSWKISKSLFVEGQYVMEVDPWISVSDISSIRNGASLRFVYQGETYQVEVVNVTQDTVVGRVTATGSKVCEKVLRMEFLYSLMKGIKMLTNDKHQ